MNYTKRKCKNTDLCQKTHFLQIKSLRTDTYHRSTVSVQLCPKTDRDGNVIAQIFPIFNKDNKIYTPAFCLEVDKGYSIEQDQQMWMDHIRKVKDGLEQKSQIYVPKPNNKNQYCSVCKQNYIDYWEHINDSKHVKTIKKAKFNKCIGQLCSLYKSQYPNRDDKQQTTKQVVQEEQSPLRKVRKIQQLPSLSQIKLQPSNSISTNISNPINYQIQNIYNPYQFNYNFQQNYPFPVYCYPGVPYNYSTQRIPSNFTNLPGYQFIQYAQPLIQYQNFA